MSNIFSEVEDLVEGMGKKVLIISHRKPDGDTLGAAIALRIWLGELGHQVTLACVDKPDHCFNFLPHIDEYVGDFDLSNFDFGFVVDAGASYMTNFHLKYDNLFNSIPIVNIDHHTSNDDFGMINLVDVEAASTTVIVYKMMISLGVVINNDMATALMTGIYNDTGSFMHSNTDAEVLKIAGDLMAKGAQIADISRHMFKTKTISTLRLWGKVFEGVFVTDEDVVMAVVKENEYEESNSTSDQLSGVIDYLNMIPEGKFSVLVNEDDQGNVKGSLRTRKADVDVSAIAAVFGGGGHQKASGFSVPGRLHRSLRYDIVSRDMSKKTLDF